MPMPPKKEKPFVFSEAFTELEQIAAWFEKEEVDLDEALVKFERGLTLAEGCKKKLSDAEERIQQIRKKFDSPELSEE